MCETWYLADVNCGFHAAGMQLLTTWYENAHNPFEHTRCAASEMTFHAHYAHYAHFMHILALYTHF